MSFSQYLVVADPEIPKDRCANLKGGSTILLFGKILTENCMKMKGIQMTGMASLVPALDPPLFSN